MRHALCSPSEALPRRSSNFTRSLDPRSSVRGAAEWEWEKSCCWRRAVDGDSYQRALQLEAAIDELARRQTSADASTVVSKMDQGPPRLALFVFFLLSFSDELCVDTTRHDSCISSGNWRHTIYCWLRTAWNVASECTCDFATRIFSHLSSRKAGRLVRRTNHIRRVIVIPLDC